MPARPLLLGVNIDHVATLRQVRGTAYPDPVAAAGIAERAGADGITVHLREDRRHIQERDVRILTDTVATRLNLEMAATDAMVDLALELVPKHCCLVPERREELTTEGGLDVAAALARLTEVCARLGGSGIEVALFIEPDPAQIEAAIRSGAPAIELHTGVYANARGAAERGRQLDRIVDATTIAAGSGLIVNAGHGLDYHNVEAIAAVPELNELNIGHAIMARAVLVGLEVAVRDMKQLMREARS